MNSFLLILGLANFLGLVYLSYLIIKKYGQANASVATAITSGIEKVNLVRFNPFEDQGGDQSFILVLLDHSSSGVIVTSLHHRNFTRVYAKPIKNGQGDNIALSKEEKSAILKTINR